MHVQVYTLLNFKLIKTIHFEFLCLHIVIQKSWRGRKADFAKADMFEFNFNVDSVYMEGFKEFNFFLSLHMTLN